MSIPRWPWRVLRWLLIGMSGLGLVVAAFYCFENWQGTHAWREYAAQSAAQGEILDALPSPSVLPPERNFMKTPVLDRWAFGPGDDPEFREYLEAIHAPQKSMNYLGREKSGGWVGEAWVDCAKTAETWFGVLAEEQARAEVPKEPPARRLLALMAEMEPVLDELRHAALDRPDSELARAAAIPRNGPLQAPIVRFQLARGLSYGLAAHGCATLSEGTIEAAFADTLAGVKLTRGFLAMPDPTIIEPMIGVVLTRIALQPLWEGNQQHAWTDQQLGQLQAELSAMHPLEAFERGMRTDRAELVLTLDQASGKVSELPRLGWLCWPTGWTQRSRVAYCTCMQLVLDIRKAAGTADFLKFMESELTKLDAFVSAATFWGSPRIILGVFAVPAVRKPLAQAVRAEAFVALARTACALERYRIAHGRYPDALAVLAPAFLDAMPRDVIDGQPLRYHRLENGTFKLYSIALDGNDDAGTPADSNGSDTASGVDWCWVQLVK